MLDLNFNYSKVNFNVCFKDKICILNGQSGSGKTFLLKVLQEYFNLNGVSSYRVYSDIDMLKDKEVLEYLIKDYEILLLDRADLYMSWDIYKKILESDVTAIICMRRLSIIKDKSNMGVYDVVYEGDRLSCVRL